MFHCHVSLPECRWWFQICFYIHPEPWGNDSQFDEHIFQMGWSNHQLVMLEYKCTFVSRNTDVFPYCKKQDVSCNPTEPNSRFFPSFRYLTPRPVLFPCQWGEPEKQHREKQHKAQRWRQANTWSRLKIMWSGLVHYCGFSPKWVGLIPEGLCFPPEFPNILKTTGNRQCLPSKNTQHEKAGAGRFLQACKNMESNLTNFGKVVEHPKRCIIQEVWWFQVCQLGAPKKKVRGSLACRSSRFFVGWNYPPLKLTFWHLKMDAWNTSFLLGSPIFRCYVSFKECNFTYGGWSVKPHLFPTIKKSRI